MECQSCPLGCVARKGQKFKAAGPREGTRVEPTRQGVMYATCGTRSLVVGNWSQGQAREHRGHLDLSRGGCPKHRDPAEPGDTYQTLLGRLRQGDHSWVQGQPELPCLVILLYDLFCLLLCVGTWCPQLSEQCVSHPMEVEL